MHKIIIRFPLKVGEVKCELCRYIFKDGEGAWRNNNGAKPIYICDDCYDGSGEVLVTQLSFWKWKRKMGKEIKNPFPIFGKGAEWKSGREG